MPEVFQTKAFRIASTIILLLFAVALITLAIFVHYHKVLGLDIFLSRDLQSEGDNSFRQSLIYHFFYSVSWFGKTLVAAIMIFITAFLFWLGRYWRESIFVAITPVAALINSGIKLLVNRPRPSEQFVHVLNREMDASFPSGHVVFYTVFFGLIIATMFYVKKLPRVVRGLIAFFASVMIISVSFSRVYLGAHWTTDVIAGYFEGFILLFILLYFYLSSKD